MRASVLASLVLCAGFSLAGSGHEDRQWTKEELQELQDKWGYDVSSSIKHVFTSHILRGDTTDNSSGPFLASAPLPTSTTSSACLTSPAERYDIAIIGAPFDTAVSYRPGARFGPRSIRAASARQVAYRSFNPRANINPYSSWARIVDCGDMPITPYDNAIASEQMTQGLTELGSHRTVSSVSSKPRLITLGGDHSLTLPALRALNKIYGRPVRVLHFDAHLDTWNPSKYPTYWGTTQFTHGSMFWMADKEGLLPNASSEQSVHAGLRTRLGGTDLADYDDDTSQNWVRFSADEIDEVGTRGIIDGIMAVLGTEDPVYLSVDIDVLDPAFAPGTGTPEPGGWTTRELIRILRGIEDLNLVGADIVEVLPAYQGNGEETSLAAAQVAYEMLTSMVKKGLQGMGKEGEAAASDAKDEL